jgi:hypothetical protein
VKTLIHEGTTYAVSDEEPEDGDIVLTDNYGIWEYRKAPCPMPYWGNPFTCKKLIRIK